MTLDFPNHTCRLLSYNIFSCDFLGHYSWPWKTSQIVSAVLSNLQEEICFHILCFWILSSRKQEIKKKVKPYDFTLFIKSYQINIFPHILHLNFWILKRLFTEVLLYTKHWKIQFPELLLRGTHYNSILQ